MQIRICIVGIVVQLPHKCLRTALSFATRALSTDVVFSLASTTFGMPRKLSLSLDIYLSMLIVVC
jgi:hypothetical protein